MLSSEMNDLVVRLTYDAEPVLEEIRFVHPRDAQEAERLFEEFQKKEARYRSLQMYSENAQVLTEDANKKRHSFSVQGWMGGRGTFGARVMNPRVTATFESGSDIESRQRESQDMADWKPLESRKLASAEQDLQKSVDELWQYLQGILGLQTFLAQYPARLRQRKYEQANRWVRECTPGDDDYCRAMEYYARLGDYEEAPQRLEDCSRAMYRREAKGALITSVKFFLIMAAVIWVVGWMFGFFGADAELSAALHGMLGSRLNTQQLMTASAYIMSVPRALFWSLLYAALPFVVISQLVMLVRRLLRRSAMQGRWPLSGGEREWQTGVLREG